MKLRRHASTACIPRPAQARGLRLPGRVSEARRGRRAREAAHRGRGGAARASSTARAAAASSSPATSSRSAAHPRADLDAPYVLTVRAAHGRPSTATTRVAATARLRTTRTRFTCIPAARPVPPAAHDAAARRPGIADRGGRRPEGRGDLHRQVRPREGAVPLGSRGQEGREQLVLDPRLAAVGRQGLGLGVDSAHRPGGDRRLPRRRSRSADHHRPRLQRRADAALRAAGRRRRERREVEQHPGRRRLQRDVAERHEGQGAASRSTASTTWRRRSSTTTTESASATTARERREERDHHDRRQPHGERHDNESISIGGNRTEDVEKNETISIGGNRTETSTRTRRSTSPGTAPKALARTKSVTIGPRIAVTRSARTTPSTSARTCSSTPATASPSRPATRA